MRAPIDATSSSSICSCTARKRSRLSVEVVVERAAGDLGARPRSPPSRRRVAALGEQLSRGADQRGAGRGGPLRLARARFRPAPSCMHTVCMLRSQDHTTCMSRSPTTMPNGKAGGRTRLWASAGPSISAAGGIRPTSSRRGAADRVRPRPAGQREPLAQGRRAASPDFRCITLDLPLGSHTRCRCRGTPTCTGPPLAAHDRRRSRGARARGRDPRRQRHRRRAEPDGRDHAPGARRPRSCSPRATTATTSRRACSLVLQPGARPRRVPVLRRPCGSGRCGGCRSPSAG